jgi:hypothetical protein
MKLLYQIFLFLTLLSVVLFTSFHFDFIPKLESASSNVDSFLAALFLVFGVLGILTTTVFGTFAFSIAFVFDDKLPSSKFYHWGMPLFFCIPGYSVCLYFIYNWLGIGI